MEGKDRKDSSCEVWRNSTLLCAKSRQRHIGMDERGKGGGRERGWRKGERDRDGER